MLRLLSSSLGMHAHRSPRIHCDGVELAGSADTDTLVFFAMHFPRNASLDPTDVALLQCNLKLAPHFQYRPAIACAEYADALRRGTNELWHPVKDRSCLPGLVSGL